VGSRSSIDKSRDKSCDKSCAKHCIPLPTTGSVPRDCPAIDALGHGVARAVGGAGAWQGLGKILCTTCGQTRRCGPAAERRWAGWQSSASSDEQPWGHWRVKLPPLSLHSFVGGGEFLSYCRQIASSSYQASERFS
jgi:hypothetical protein